MFVAGPTSPSARADGNWPSFRGPNACGVADGRELPVSWDVETNVGVAWKTPIPGLAHSSPIVWGDRLYVTTADSGDPDPLLRVGLYGESPDHPENTPHDFRVYCLNKKTGEIIWEKVAHRGVPTIKRHIKSTHANCTPATDGKHIVALFGSEGLYGYNADGEQLWKQDLGKLDAGAFDAPEIQWEFASSPVIHGGTVFLQCDTNSQSFIAAYDVETGKQKWRTERNDNPAWSTPAIWTAGSPPRTQIVVNGFKHIGGYDASTGESIWHMRGGGDIPVPTPLVLDDFVYITNAHGGRAPVYAIKASATGDITPADAATTGDHVAWSYDRIGAYMQTPIVYQCRLYVCRDNGVLSCLQPKTGEKIFRERLAGAYDGFSASAVAGDGKLYYTSEEGTVHVLKAGPIYEVLASNKLAETCMATPAISDGRLYFRTRRHVVAIAK
ncbi:MAG: PQQ-binding-like beta-propeller repeat protein [Phycisphaerales bacterium]|nr:PQQ-binding-like beta-propeller repeat protein [Phycisphaerales bacterium]